MSSSKFATRWRVHSPKEIPWCGSAGDSAKLAPNTCTSTSHLLPCICLSIEIESFYFNCRLLAELRYEHARSSSSAGDENHVQRGVPGIVLESRNDLSAEAS